MARLFTFFLLQLKQFPGAVYELYTCGELRVVNKHFADFMNSQPITTARVVAGYERFIYLMSCLFTKVVLRFTEQTYFVTYHQQAYSHW